ncbi:DUF393 domain-containing protein [Streptomyces sp. NPDC090798]|uniref:DUF393 domain-containing protein n=1 Tax=Streptomyces sp. NPDC090798 TaxID=3365968 RepID=UPI003806C330
MDGELATSTGVRPSPPVLAHDGDRGFCQASVDRIRAVAAPTLEAVPWQFLPAESTAPRLERLDREVPILRGDAIVAGGADASVRFVGSSPSDTYRAAATVVDLPGVRTCTRVVYRPVPRNRRPMPGSTAACAAPPLSS